MPFLNIGEEEGKTRFEVDSEELAYQDNVAAFNRTIKKMSRVSWCLASFGNVVFKL